MLYINRSRASPAHNYDTLVVTGSRKFYIYVCTLKHMSSLLGGVESLGWSEGLRGGEGGRGGWLPYKSDGVTVDRRAI